MAIYGVGAHHEGDVSDDFVREGLACVGWTVEDAPAVHRLLEHIRTGDIVYIKSHPPGRKLLVKAVGIVEDEVPIKNEHLGRGVPVRWLWRGIHSLHEGDNERYNVRSNTLYEELSPAVQKTILDLLFSSLSPR